MKLPKTKSITAINYYIITGTDNMNYLHTPLEFYEVFDLLRQFPKDIFQISESLGYYQSQIIMKTFQGLDISISTYDSLIKDTTDKLINEHLDLFSAKRNVKVFLINGTEKNENIAKVTKQIYNVNGFKYITSFNDPLSKVKKYCEDIYFSNVHEFLNRINLDKKEILQDFPEHYQGLDFNVKVEKNFEEVNNFTNFFPCFSNYFTLNQIVNNFWVEGAGTQTNPLKDDNVDFQEHLNNRWDMILEKVDNIDKFNHMLYSLDYAKHVTGWDPYFETMILVFPFQNPDYKYYINKAVNNVFLKKLLLSMEQELDFTVRPNINTPKDISEIELKNFIGMVSKKEADKFLFLDYVAYLHASFSYSPIIRFPQVGKSIYKNLSYLNPDNVNFEKSNPLKTIFRFGKNLAKITMPDSVSEFLKTRSRQIFAISDLPIEWLVIDDVPLCFSHDICRLPESNYRSLVSNYIANQRFTHSISENILSETLVIFGASDEARDEYFKAWYPTILEQSIKLGFKVVHCKSKKEVVEIVNTTKPELLIFNCHGDYDHTTKTSFLWIGNEKLIGEDIINGNIYAPLIFLSACKTSPTYGFIKLIAEAFFQVGATSVTSTFLPIGIDEGLTLYIRLLNQLAIASKGKIHENWLSFISHIIRTSIIQESHFKSKKNISKEHEENQIGLLNDSMIFNKRRDVYKKLNLENLSNEFLFYSNLGRSDLILFDSWVKEKKRINGVQ